jgi:hypothetical protein
MIMVVLVVVVLSVTIVGMIVRARTTWVRVRVAHASERARKTALQHITNSPVTRWGRWSTWCR